MTLPRTTGLLALGGVLVMLAAACSSSDSTAANGAPSGWGGGWYGYGGSSGSAGSTYVGTGGSGAFGIPDATPPTFNPLCGVRTCDPGYRKACSQLPPPTVEPDAASPTGGADATIDAGSADGDASVQPDARADGSTTDSGAAFAPLATDGGGVQKAATDAAADTASGDGGTVQQAPDAASADAQAPAFGCYIDKIGAELVPTCAPAGTAAEKGACTDSHECTPGLGCVDVSFSLECADASSCDAASLVPRGECRQLYCALPVTCPASTFYQELPLRVAGETSPYKVPVCVPIDGCDMVSSSPCSGGRVCTIVGDNATTCLLPGTAQRDEVCDDQNRCAEGLVCSKSSNTCLKLCHTGSGECPGGTCQGGSAAFPQGMGVCLGDKRDAGSAD